MNMMSMESANHSVLIRIIIERKIDCIKLELYMNFRLFHQVIILNE